jgi:hypothetical protein
MKTSHLKDAIRLGFYELGEIHYKYGYINEAIKAFIKSHDYSINQDDLYKSSVMIARIALELKHITFINKYSGEAN